MKKLKIENWKLKDREAAVSFFNFQFSIFNSGQTRATR